MPWLITIVRREKARLYERKRIRTVDISAHGYHEGTGLSTTPNTDVVDVRRALAELDDGYREPLVLQVLIGLTMNEIAEIMRLTSSTACTRLFRAREKLRATSSRSKRLKQQDSRQPYQIPN